MASGDNSGSIHTTTGELYLTAGSHVYLDNDRDLASLSLYATGSSAATYQILSNELLFDRPTMAAACRSTRCATTPG